MYDDLKGKAALITGAGKWDGLGFAIGEKLASCGCDVVLTDIESQKDELRKLAADIKKRFGVKVFAQVLDVTSQESVDGMIMDIRKNLPHIHVLVNNAGAAVGAPSLVQNYDDAAWIKTFEINFHGVYRVSKAVLPLMIGHNGTIINMSSKAGKAPIAFNGAYGCAKAAVMTLTKVMAKELASSAIRVNAICPGLIMTGLQKARLDMEAKWYDSTPAEVEKRLSQQIPLGYFAKPHVVADLAAFLASKESAYITGQAINVDGGQVMEL